MSQRLWYVLLLLACVAVGCGGGDGDYGDYGGSQGTRGIVDVGSAEYMLTDLIEGVIVGNVLRSLSHGNFSGRVVTGSRGGTATVTGVYDYDPDVGCGSGCVKSQANVHLTIVFNNYTVMSCDNCATVVNGVVEFDDDTWSKQSSYSYSGGGFVKGKGSGVFLSTHDTDGTWGYEDMMTFDISAYKGKVSSSTGWCQGSSGTRYNL